jgi:ribosome-associated protein
VSAIVVSETVRVPASAITVRASRASGPGGQNVNKVATRIELRVELALIEGLDEEARRRLQHLVARRLDADGRRLVVTSQVTRTQSGISRTPATRCESSSPMPSPRRRPGARPGRRGRPANGESPARSSAAP